MKRIISLFLTLMTVVLSGCGNSNDYVPDSYVNMTVSEILDQRTTSVYARCDKILEHTSNPSDHTDMVKFEMAFDYRFCSEIYSATSCFQYLRDNDIWTCLRTSEPQFLRTEWNEIEIRKYSFSNEDSKYKYGQYEWDVDIAEIDLENCTITVTYDIWNYYNNQDSLNWCETETLDFVFDNVGNIRFDIPCGYTIGDKSYDLKVRIELGCNSSSSRIIGW